MISRIVAPCVAFVLWSAIWWRFRGGAFTTLTGINPGTQGMRAITGVALAAPLALIHGMLWMTLAPAFLLGLALTGWEEFQMMGSGGALETEKPGYWMRRLPGALGLTVGTVSYDIVGMTEALVVSLLPPAVTLCGILVSPIGMFMLMAAPIGAISYAACRFTHLPAIPKFANGQEWGEVFTGAAIGVVLWAI